MRGILCKILEIYRVVKYDREKTFFELSISSGYFPVPEREKWDKHDKTSYKPLSLSGRLGISAKIYRENSQKTAYF